MSVPNPSDPLEKSKGDKPKPAPKLSEFDNICRAMETGQCTPAELGALTARALRLIKKG